MNQCQVGSKLVKLGDQVRQRAGQGMRGSYVANRGVVVGFKEVKGVTLPLVDWGIQGKQVGVSYGVEPKVGILTITIKQAERWIP